MTDKRNRADYQRDVAAFVDRNIKYCVSQLVDAIGEDMDSEAVAELSIKDDWMSPATEAGMKLFKNDEGKYAVLDMEPACFLYDIFFDNAEEAAREYCSLHDLDPYQSEALEFWLVSEWLAEKLQERGELVNTDFYGLTVWGRTCSGQAILLDSVICDIYDEAMPAA